METVYPHQVVIDFYGLHKKNMGAHNNNIIKTLNEKIKKNDLTPEEKEELLKESKLLAAALIERFQSNADFEKSEEQINELNNKLEESFNNIIEDIENEKEKENENENEEDVLEVEEVLPPSDEKNSKIQSIIEFLQKNKEASEEELKELGLKNIDDVEEIILIPNKYKLVKNNNGKYKLHKKTDVFGWVILGFGTLVALFLGYKHFYNKKD